MQKITVIISFLICTGIAAQTKIDMSAPPQTPAVFAEGAISTGQRERDMAISADGTELFYTLQSPAGMFQTILYRKKDGKGNWSEPAVASFAGRFSDLEPAFSADGNKLFFSSNRPLTGNSVKDFDIWYSEKKNGVWGEAKHAGTVINTAADEFYPSLASNGNLYFTAAYKNGVGKEDIFMAAWKDGKYTEPIALDTAVNSVTFEFNAFVSPDEQFIIFTSWGRKDDKGKGDLYISTKDAGGKWQPAKNLTILNSDKTDYCPFVSVDKKILFFTSERNSVPATYAKPATYSELIKSYNSPSNASGDIYWVDFSAVLKSLNP